MGTYPEVPGAAGPEFAGEHAGLPTAGTDVGSIIVSVILGLPTYGLLLLRALMAEDLFVSAAIVMMLGTLTVIGTLIAENIPRPLGPAHHGELAAVSGDCLVA